MSNTINGSECVPPVLPGAAEAGPRALRPGRGVQHGEGAAGAADQQVRGRGRRVLHPGVRGRAERGRQAAVGQAGREAHPRVRRVPGGRVQEAEPREHGMTGERLHRASPRQPRAPRPRRALTAGAGITQGLLSYF
ncbi:hypothetical protein AVEN_101204-1 [Araneus ventricosus]|uniref:Uncharacterized protein n=1 Tax=Araneus ventricosus TaxID=182803 RepID=A0A4Y2K924_ARAVE|nr:hypothetical protein AVEN_101204-1 [Araneus ventricosus]